MRVLVLDRDGRILLFQDSDPGIGASWWITPGGGIDPGETEHETVLRELEEETGLRVTTDDVIGPIARRHVRHGYSDLVVEQDDAFYAVRVPAFEVDTAGHTEEEQVTMLASRWWTPAEVAASDEEIWPVLLLDLVALLDSSRRLAGRARPGRGVERAGVAPPGRLRRDGRPSQPVYARVVGRPR